jgi:hypothetical protein
MERVKFRVLGTLAAACLLCVVLAGCAGLFGASKRTSQVSEAGLIPEVPDIGTYNPDHNPQGGRASTRPETGGAFALPATVLRPEAPNLPTPVYSISGIKGQEISDKWYWPEVVDVRVDLPPKVSFNRRIYEGEDVSDWIVNLPQGLEGRAHAVKKGASYILIYVTGKPKETMREQVRVRIPGTFLSNNAAFDTASPNEAESLKAWEESQAKLNN